MIQRKNQSIYIVKCISWEKSFWEYISIPWQFLFYNKPDWMIVLQITKKSRLYRTKNLPQFSFFNADFSFHVFIPIHFDLVKWLLFENNFRFINTIFLLLIGFICLLSFFFSTFVKLFEIREWNRQWKLKLLSIYFIKYHNFKYRRASLLTAHSWSIVFQINIDYKSNFTLFI